MGSNQVPSNSAASSARWERRKEARPAELLSAALDLFVERGYAGTRADDVAARAGVSKGTLYLYFSNKEELFKAVVRENIVRSIDEARSEVESYTGSSVELLPYLISEWWRRIGETRASGITKLMVAESGNFPEITRFYLDEVIEPAHALFEGVIERGIARGEFRAVDVPHFVRVMIAPMVMLLLWKHSLGPCSAKPTDPRKFLAAYSDMAINALRPDAATSAEADKGKRKTKSA